jgi:hypothetical protein
MATRKQTTKKAATTAAKTPVDALLETAPYPGETMFQVETFNDKEGAGYARYIIDVVNRVRKIDSDLENETRTFEKNCLTHERAKLIDFLENQDHDVVKSAVDNFEKTESEYWTRYLGKKAAIEILTNNRVSADTMSMMVKLSEDDYKQVTQICVKLASAITQATKEAEEEIGFFSQDAEEQKPSLTDKGPRQLKLKKIKKAS